MRKFRLPLWALAWLVVVLGALVVLLANQPAVDRILAVTGLEKALYPNGKNAAPSVVQAGPDVQTILVDPAPVSAPVPAPAPNVSALDTADPGTDVPAEPSAPAPDPTAAPEPPLPSTPNTYRLYFLKLSPEGRMEPSAFVRELPAGSTPLGATLKALLLGPTLQDKARGALNLIPDGTKLLSVRLRDRVALVSLSEEFEHNASGTEGLAGELRQVVWTATQFGSVDAVQVLVNGQYRDTLGESGISIAGPSTNRIGGIAGDYFGHYPVHPRYRCEFLR